MKVDFWQLSRDPAEKVCALIAERVLGSGERLLVVSKDVDQREAISKALWKAGPESFLANGESDEDGADRQPVLLSDKPEPVNGASHVIFADGEFRETSGFARSFLLFDDATVEQARATWRLLDGKDGLERAFFRQDGGKWVKVA
ncbi:DNA polymerase III subunit chi [Erythrobacter sp. THAF29]|uniref:DNA polymerase III subunit chi n=1 Tax=Erythrobacter sp. THAF29 TaxID=2587851 RepID=UPI00126785F1|nr:DNA polymerase III subunit chi [Erythrobacter sp. THAF29]QFT78408.1 DNA polymerase III subunit chi [Erythrobacter sp. THAF29]